MFYRSRILLGLVAVLSMLAACSGDNPTAPEQSNAPPANSGGGGTVWTITLQASANNLVTSATTPSTITLSVRRASDGQKPQNGTTIAIATTLGEFDAIGSGLRSGVLSLFDGTARVNLFAGSQPGTARVTAQLESSRGSTNVTIGDRPTFFLQSVEPNTGSPNGGDSVVIRGGGFLEPVRVLFDGNAGVVESVNDSRIRVRTPAINLQPGSTESVTVSVTNNLNGPDQASDSLINAFIYTFGGSPNQPRAFTVTPGSGPNEGGTQVVITGENFESPVQVIFGQGGTPSSFNGVEADVISVTPTRIVVIAPSATDFGQQLLNSQVNVLIRNVNTGLATIANDAFTYGPQVLVTEISPNSGPASGDQLVTIFGQGFVEPLQVRLGSVVDPQSLVSVTPTEISIRTVGVETGSCGNVSGPVIVTLLDTGNENQNGPTYVYQVTSDGPRISGLNNSQGPAAGGTAVTITGTNFYSNTEVTFGDRPGNVTNISPTQVLVTTPFLPDSQFLTESCDDNLDGTNGERYLETPVDVLVTNLSTTCESAFPEGFVYSPPTTVCRNDVGAVDPPTASFSTSVIDPVTSTVQFNDTSSGSPTGWQWDFDNDGINDSTLQFPQFSFPAAGTYAVKLTVSNAGGADTTVQTVTVP